MKTIRAITFPALATVMIIFSPPSLHAADDAYKMDMKRPMSGPASMTEGEVRKVDKEAGKITLRHGPIANLKMPGMTMVFRVSDPALLDQVKTDDKVRFSAEKMNGALTVTWIETVP